MKMKIVNVQSWKADLKLTRPYTIAYQRVDAVENLFVRIEAENGHVGIGAASPSEDVTGESTQACEMGLADQVAPILMGADLRCCRSLLRQLDVALAKTPAARAAVDIALHDLVAGSLGLPLVDLLGRVHDAMPTSITIGILPLDEMLAEAAEYIGRGFRCLKVKTGINVEEDIERLIKVREQVGAAVTIRVDANQGYSPEEYGRFIRETTKADLEFVEQPLPRSDLDAMRVLPEAVRKFSAADESLIGPDDALTCLIPPHPFGIFNIKLMKCGGIAPGMEIAAMAARAGIDLMWGCMDESIVSIAAALHVALASPATRYLDLDGSLDLAVDLVKGGFILENGTLRTTADPGLGVTCI
ncbi:mandelate racemase/muconate lactonizing enzyme family protein [Desulfosarcina ovata]|uniref:Dipeptide epimerase n=1 Tax=Desulfosarcina ovata subsp. ovata TaxID=2752305 RepID=A0A5K8AHS4_9BACT|nr:dipeptide epimerase [Desulfosarcina ovata]BBO92235.1 dipeptide epimerase [Desulfosarcina ovata subsp. ovata]